MSNSKNSKFTKIVGYSLYYLQFRIQKKKIINLSIAMVTYNLIILTIFFTIYYAAISVSSTFTKNQGT